MVRRTLGVLICLAPLISCTQVQLRMREPGDKILTFPGPVSEQYGCHKRKLPFFKIEKSELSPHHVKPGARVNYRYVYVMCPAKIADVVDGVLHTRIHYKGKSVFSDVVRRELQPGRWVVDSFVTIPEAAQPGMYALEAEFKSPRGHFQVHSSFLVQPK